MKRIHINENGINLVLEIDDNNEAKLLHFSALPFDEKNLECRSGTLGFRLVEVNVSGLDRPLERHGNKYIVTAPGYRLKFKDLKDTANQLGRKLEITTYDEPTGLEVVSHFQFYNGISVARTWTTVTNTGGYGICVQKGDAELLAAINAMLAEMKDNDSFKAIVDKYFSGKGTPTGYKGK